MGKREEAMALHAGGYNCAQAVICAFAEELGADKAELFAMAEGFGLGGGTMEGICGALAGATMVAGLKNSDRGLDSCRSKGATRKLSTEIQKKFKDRAGSIICKELKGIGTGKMLCSCPECVGIGAEAAEEMLKAL